MIRLRRVGAGITLAALAACSSGDSSPTCEYTTQTVLATGAAWPKFRRDLGNTGRSPAAIGAEPSVRWKYPAPELHDLGPISGSPIIDTQGQVFVIGRSGDPASRDIRGYRLDPEESTPTPNVIMKITSGASVTTAPLLGADGTLYVTTGDGYLYRFRTDGTPQTSVYLGGYVATSPTIGADGAVYASNLSGIFSSVCPNGVPRFSIPIGSTQSSAAITANGRIIVADNDGSVQAIDAAGRQLWTFFASGPVTASVALDETAADTASHRVYIADVRGLIFAAFAGDGRPAWPAPFHAGAAVSASPAVGTEALYVADENGTLYAIDLGNGRERWTFGPVGPILSSPVVATTGDDDVVLFGSDDGRLYAIIDAVDHPETLWTLDLTDGPIGKASAAIDAHGTIFIGTQGGHVFAIDTGAAAGSPTPAPTPTATPS